MVKIINALKSMAAKWAKRFCPCFLSKNGGERARSRFSADDKDISNGRCDMSAKSVKMIVGLGNPGAEYAWTRHNAGAIILTYFREKHRFQKNRNEGPNITSMGDVEGRKTLLVWPQSFMNNSGIALKRVMNNYGVGPENILVVHDDLDLPLGRVKFVHGGSFGGHNGLKSIFENVPEEFDRLRFGIGRQANPEFESVVEFVLSQFNDVESELVKKAMERTANALKIWVAQGLVAAQNVGNRSEPVFKSLARKKKKIKPEKIDQEKPRPEDALNEVIDATLADKAQDKALQEAQDKDQDKAPFETPTTT
jgi:PTH1 family peptidyl-tRNA hydrolase